MPTLPRPSVLYSYTYRCIMPATMMKTRMLATSLSVAPLESFVQTSRNGKALSAFQLNGFLCDRRLAAVGQPAFLYSHINVDGKHMQTHNKHAEALVRLRAGWKGNGALESVFYPQSSSSSTSWTALGVWSTKTSRGLSTSEVAESKKHVDPISQAAVGSVEPESEPEVDGGQIESGVCVSVCEDREDVSGATPAAADVAMQTDADVEKEKEKEKVKEKERETDAVAAGIDEAGRARERRRRSFGASIARHAHGPLPDLLTVPGIGPRNMEKLVAKGIAKLAELKQLYRDKFRDDGSDKMVEFLRSSVGILHKHHAASITNYIRDKVEAELAPKDDGPRPKKRLTFCVEGNISVGKSTFLQKIASETLELQDLVEIVPEPVAKWQDVGASHHNILESFYKEPERYAYTFQNYVFVTRLMQERESANGLKPLRLMERSVFSDRMVFVRAVHEAKWMSDMEISIYDSWFNPVVSELPGLVPDAFIYLRASPDTCLQRLQSRKRPEEHGVSLDYLRDLHEKHEKWLLPAQTGSGGVLSVSPALRAPMSPRICDRVFYLEGDHVHSCIQKVPALMLDCDQNIDFSKDLEAKAEYARQVAEFFEYVQQTKDTESGTGNQLVLPRSGGLLGPDGAHLLGNLPLDAADLSRRMSSLCV